MSDVASGAANAGAETAVRIGYFAIVWKELRKNRVAIFGIWCIFGLCLIAIYAPLLSFNQPIFVSIDGTWSLPLFSALFNRLLFENSVDIFFNLLLVLSPLYVAIYGLAKRRSGPRFAEVRFRVVGWLSVVHLIVLCTLLPAHLGSVENPLHRSSAVVSYADQVAGARASGKAVSVVYPIHRYGYRDTNPSESVVGPSAKHFLGTDTEGRDVFARMLFGTRISLTIGVVAVAIYVAIGVVLGALAGYYGGAIDGLISRFIEVMICFPSFFLILTLAALIEQRSIFHVMIIIGITSWTGVARLVRAEFLKHRELEYAQAARALGIPTRRIIFAHILPNAMAPVLVSATFGIASAILIESSLSFLGIGDLTVASWGETLNTGRLEGKLWLILAPGFAIFFVVTVFNLVGEGLRDALDPKLRS